MSIRKFVIVCTLALGTKAFSQDVPLPPDIKRWGSIPIVKDEVFISLPAAYPMAVAWDANRPGLYTATYYPRGQSKDNWTETLRLMAFQGVPNGDESPAKQMLQIVSQPVKTACPDSYFFEATAQREGKRASATMGCRRLQRDSSLAIYGYYLAIQGQESMYVLAREFRSSAFQGDIPVSKDTQAQWQSQLDSTTICRRSEICVK